MYALLSSTYHVCLGLTKNQQDHYKHVVLILAMGPSSYN
jgi:hypothetical protein